MNAHVDIILMSTRAFIMLVPGLAYLCGVWSLLVQGWSLAFRVDYLSVALDLDTPWLHPAWPMYSLLASQITGSHLVNHTTLLTCL